MPADDKQNGIKSCYSKHSVDDTVARLEALLHEKSIKLFAIVDHSGEALAAGLKMPPTRLVIFGSPRAGTPVMLAAPSAALDLPLKILIAQQRDGNVMLSWNDPEWLRQRHGFPEELTANLSAIEVLAAKAAQ
jgi:uncharacterized protein (DUF302 family)